MIGADDSYWFNKIEELKHERKLLKNAVKEILEWVDEEEFAGYYPYKFPKKAYKLLKDSVWDE